MTNPTGDLDDIVHHRHRLGILTITAEAREVEFGFLRETLELTPGNLNRHLAVLEAAGLVTIRKEFQGRRPKTWVSISRPGRKALSREIQTLQHLVERHATSSDSAQTDGRSTSTRPSRAKAPLEDIRPLAT